MKKLDVQFTNAPGESLPVGTLAEDRGRVYFEYRPEFLDTGLNLSPFRLPFETGLVEHTDREFGPAPAIGRFRPPTICCTPPVPAASIP